MYGSRLRLTEKSGTTESFSRNNVYKNRTHVRVVEKVLNNEFKYLKKTQKHNIEEAINNLKLAQALPHVANSIIGTKIPDDEVEEEEDEHEYNNNNAKRSFLESTIDSIEVATSTAEKEFLKHSYMASQVYNNNKQIVSVNSLRSKKRKVAALQKKVDVEKRRIDTFIRKKSLLKTFGKIDTLVFVDHLSHGENNDIIVIDADRCPLCSNVFKQNATTNLNTCNKCFNVVERLFVVEDSSSDILILRSGVSGTNENARKRKKGENIIFCKDSISKKRLSMQLSTKAARDVYVLGHDDDGNNNKKTDTGSEVIDADDNNDHEEQPMTTTNKKNITSNNIRTKKKTTYSRFIMQFIDTRPDIPNNVMRLVYDQLSTIHLLSSIRCRATPVASILRSHNLLEWVPYATVISRQFNGQWSPRIPKKIIHAVIERFDLITRVTTDKERKTLGVDLLTSTCLAAEGELKFSRAFSLMKTRSVMRLSSTRLREAITRAEIIEPSVDWSLVPFS